MNTLRYYREITRVEENLHTFGSSDITTYCTYFQAKVGRVEEQDNQQSCFIQVAWDPLSSQI